MLKNTPIPLHHVGGAATAPILLKRLAHHIGLGRAACLIITGAILLIVFVVFHVIEATNSADANGWYEFGGATTEWTHMPTSNIESSTWNVNTGKWDSRYWNHSRGEIIDGVKAFHGTLIVFVDLTVASAVVIIGLNFSVHRLLGEQLMVRDVAIITGTWGVLTFFTVIMLWLTAFIVLIMYTTVPCPTDGSVACIGQSREWAVLGLSTTLAILFVPPVAFISCYIWDCWKSWCDLSGIRN